jgi:uncharacterized BrkB/YihY/UPF0761 family membrane protein
MIASLLWLLFYFAFVFLIPTPPVLWMRIAIAAVAATAGWRIAGHLLSWWFYERPKE